MYVKYKRNVSLEREYKLSLLRMDVLMVASTGPGRFAVAFT